MSDTNGAAAPAAADIRSKLAGATEPPYDAVYLDGIGPARVYAMTGKQLGEFQRESRRRRKRDPDNVRESERLVILCLRDTSGQPVFTPADEAALAGLPVTTLQRVVKAALRVNGLTDDDDDEGRGPN